MQEAYRLPCSKYSLCCPNWVPPRPGWGGTLPGGVPDLGTSQQGTPPGLTWQGTPPGWTWQGIPPPVAAPWHSGKCCKALWDMGTPPRGQTEGQTLLKTLPSRRTTYAGGNNYPDASCDDLDFREG